MGFIRQPSCRGPSSVPHFWSQETPLDPPQDGAKIDQNRFFSRPRGPRVRCGSASKRWRFSGGTENGLKTPPRGLLEASKILFQASWAHLGPPGGAKIAIWPKRNANFSNSHTLEHERGRKGLGRGSRGPREAREADFDPFWGSKMGPSRGQKYLGRLQEASWGRLGGDFSWA